MFKITSKRFGINISVNQQTPIKISTGGPAVSFIVANAGVTYVTNAGLTNVYTHTLSQIDIDNKFIVVSGLSTITDKSKALLFIENAGIMLEYGVDYSIDTDNKISWSNTPLENQLIVGDKIKICF